jgi:tetratricopeptide (TPR) repeat protein
LGRAYGNQALLLEGAKQPDRAEAVCRKAVALFEKLRGQSEGPDYPHLLAVSYSNLGQHLLRERRPERVEAARREAGEVLAKARELLEGLAAAFPSIPDYRHDLARSCSGLGNLLLTGARPDAAEEPLEKALKLLQELQEGAPGNHAIREEREACCRNLITFHDRRARTYAARKDWAEADRHLRRLVQLRKDLLAWSAAADPGGTREGEQKGQLAATLLARADALVLLGDHAAAAAAVAELSALVPPDWEPYPRAAVRLAQCLPLADTDPRLSAAQRRALVSRYGRDALRLLRQAADRGRGDAASLKGSLEFHPLRTRDEFREEFTRVFADLEAARRKSPPR